MCGVAVNQAVFEFGVFVLVALGVQSCGGCDDGDDDFFGCLGGFGSTVSVVVTWGCVAVGGRCGASRWGDNGRLVGALKVVTAQISPPRSSTPKNTRVMIDDARYREGGSVSG